MTRTATIYALVAIALVATLIYAFVDPSTSWWIPKCPFHYSTGYDCPGCGSQRAVHALLHGDFSRALHENAILFLMIPFLGLLLFAELTRKRRPRIYRAAYHPAVAVAAVTVVIAWGLLRNFLQIN